MRADLPAARWRFGITLALGLAACIAGWPRVFSPASASVVQAVRALGPISGWRCAQNATLAYDPSRDSADRTLIADAPEQFVEDHIQGVQVDWVEADLRGGDTLVWTRIALREDASGDVRRRLYVLSPGRLQSIGVETEAGWKSVCTVHLGAWRIVGEHALE